MTVGGGGPDARERLRRVEAVTDTALANLEPNDVLVELLDRVREVLDADTVAVFLLSPSGEELVATAARGIEEEVRQGVRIPVGHGFAGRVAARRQPVKIDHVTARNVINPTLIESGIRSLVGVPMLAAGALVGVLHVGAKTPRRFTDEDVGLLQLAADRVALVTQAQLSEMERAAASALQRSLLPARLPTVPGLELAARYVPAEEGGVSGDWYDVFLLPGDRLGIVIGDVVGHGLRAAVVMGRLRSALRAYALDAEDPAEVLTKLDRKVTHFEPDMTATVLYATVERSLRSLTLSVAGHPPPVLVHPGRPAAVVDVRPGLPLGTRIPRGRPTATVELPPGALMCFYTDGLVQRRGALPSVGLDRLSEVVHAGSADQVCALVMSKLVGNDPPSDDVALLVMHRRNRRAGRARPAS